MLPPRKQPHQLYNTRIDQRTGEGFSPAFLLFFQFRDMMNADEPIGRKLDFLVQEMNREVNTTGSKAQDVRITKLVVDMKSEIEKIREQIQNIE